MFLLSHSTSTACTAVILFCFQALLCKTDKFPSFLTWPEGGIICAFRQTGKC